MAKASHAPNWQYALIVLTGTVVGVVVVACLYWAQVVLIPVALAIFLTFLLSPLVLALQRWHLGRIPSVILVVVLTALILLGIGWLVTYEITQLASDLPKDPKYADNLRGKLNSLREMGLGWLAGSIEKGLQEFNVVLDEKITEVESSKPPRTPEPQSTPWLSRLPAALKPAMEPLSAVALASVLAIFMLLKREDLRNRFLRLLGSGRMTVTTKAVDEAGHRISRFLLMQLVVNGTYGLAWGLALFFIGVDYPLLWGFLAAFLRYVPYIGAPIAATLPIALSVVQFAGWIQPLLIVGILIVLELISNNVMEPWLYGRSIGVSEVALLVAAAFWAFLWGPIGLVLSGPLMVCLVVLGKYVPQLEYFDVLLGDEPVLEPEVAYYQRLLAGDQDEAAQIVQTHAKASSPEEVYDALLVPALTYARRDLDRDDLTDRDGQFIFQATREILEDLGEHHTAVEDEKAEEAQQNGKQVIPETKVHLLACPARDEADQIALDMLRQLLDPAKWEVEVASVKMLAAEMVSHAEQQAPAVICVGALPPGGLAHTRYLCKRLRSRFPKVKIVVGRWGLKGNLDENREQLQAAGADQVETTLLETQRHLTAWLPVLAQEQRETPREPVVKREMESVT